MNIRISADQVLRNFNKAMLESYKGREDLVEVGGSLKASGVDYNVTSLLKGESRERWIMEFGVS